MQEPLTSYSTQQSAAFAAGAATSTSSELPHHSPQADAPPLDAPALPQAAPDPALDLAALFEAHLPELLALQPSEVRRVNLDVRRLVTLVLGVLPKLAGLLPQLARLPDFRTDWAQSLEAYAWVLWHADVLALPLGANLEREAELVRQASVHRNRLLRISAAQYTSSEVAPQLLASKPGPPGTIELVRDLILLAAAIQARADETGNASAALGNALEHARELAAALQALHHSRCAKRREEKQRRNLRARALTLLLRAYDEVRMGIGYLRRNHGDAERFAPSPYAKRKKRRNRKIGQAETFLSAEVTHVEQAEGGQET